MKLRVTAASRQKDRMAPSRQDAESQALGSGENGLSEDVHRRIAALAYQLYEQRGREDGHEVEDWLVAEQKILAGQS